MRTFVMLRCLSSVCEASRPIW